ncbi:hypothetical protein IWZ01DRAFT_317703 [Phyllosticta capitalensis]
MDLFSPGDCPTRPTLKRDGFELCENQFTVSGYVRVEGKRLRQLFNPEIRKTGQVKARKDAKKLFKKEFFAAQLRHYDIKFKASGKVAEIRGLLETSLEQGKCDKLPESMVLFQRKMRSDYEPLQQEWESDVKAWEAKKKQHDDEMRERRKRLDEEDWNRCTTPQERANRDFDRFLRYHYLNEDGKPDPSKTTEVVVMSQSLVPLGVDLQRAVPGLYTAPCRCDRWGFSNIICIGWDRSAVMRTVQEENEKEAAALKRKEELKRQRLQDEWEGTVEPHRRYLSQRKNLKEEPKSFELQQCIGSYIIRCDKISGGWTVLDPLCLNVCAGVDGSLIAQYNLSIIAGTMLLSRSEKKLDELCVDLDSDDDSEKYDFEGNEKDGYRRRKWTASGEQATWDDDDAAAAFRPPKRQKTVPQPAAAPHRRVHFTMRGRENGEGEMFFIPEPGHIDFLDNACTKFTGVFYDTQLFGRNVKFEGYRISDKPQAEPESWYAFSERNYDREANYRITGWYR